MGWGLLVMVASTCVVPLAAVVYGLLSEPKAAANRAAGMFNDPAFKRRMRPLNILLFGMCALLVLTPVAENWVRRAGAPFDVTSNVASGIEYVAFMAICIVLYLQQRLRVKGLPEVGRR